MFVDGQEWKLVPVEPTPDWIANLSDKGLRIGKLESAIEDMLAAAPTPPAQDQGDDCDDVDAILRIVGLDPERCRTEGGALNVGRVRTLWEDVVSLAAQASGQAAPSDDEIETLARDYCDDPTVGAIVFTSTRDCVGFARALLSRYGQAPAASADLGGLTDAEIDAIWTRPVSATASATVIRRETAELLIRAAALKAAPVAAQAPQDERMETTSEHIARDIREGRFPQRSEPQRVQATEWGPMPDAGVEADAHVAVIEGDEAVRVLRWNSDVGAFSYPVGTRLYAAQAPAANGDALDAARWRYVRRKLCLTGNGDGTCAMQAINLPASIPGWPEPGAVAEFCDAAIDAAMQRTTGSDHD